MSRENLTKIVFQSSLGFILLKWGLAEECIPPVGSERQIIFDMIVLRKKYLCGCQIPSSKKFLETI